MTAPMLAQKINAWLNQPSDYTTGLQLLEQTGAVSSFVLTVLGSGSDVYNRKRLAGELARWVNGRVTPPPVAPSPKSAASAPKLTVQPAAQTLGLIEPIEQQAYALMDTRSALKSQIRAVLDEDHRQGDRRDWAYQIKALTRQIDGLYSSIDFVKQYGYLPPEVSLPTEVDESALLMNVRTYVSRYRKKLTKLVDQGVKPDDPRFCATDTLLKQYLDQKNQLELKLSKNNDSHPTRQQT